MCGIARLINNMIVKLLFCLVLLSIGVNCDAGKEVTVEQGRLVGTNATSRNGTKYYAFLGIPFANPPVGELRFEPPQPPDSWNGTRNATQGPPICVQAAAPSVVIGQEDCLYLNVYTPEKKNHLLPVLVFIYGGSFLTGYSMLYNPEYIMDYSAIVVIIQYRLGLLGYLSTGDKVLPGNNGMKDQVMALKWVQKNIEAFGGDPKSVTIFGESAGAASVHFHMYSPLSKGLFHRAISFSGTALSPWACLSGKVARLKALAVGIVMGCPTQNSTRLKECLKKIQPASEFIAPPTQLSVYENEPSVPFPPTIEPEDVEGAFITENPWYQKPVNDVPWINGINADDGAVITMDFLQNNGSKLKILNEDFERYAPISFFYKYFIKNDTKISHITESLKNFYFGNNSLSYNSSETVFNFTRLCTDSAFTFGGIEAAKRLNSNVYFYLYNYTNEVGSFNEVFGFSPFDLGVTHGDNLIGIFYFNGIFSKVTKGMDLKVSKTMLDYFVGFATTGNPNGKGRTNWAPFKYNLLNYLQINGTFVMKKDLFKQRYLLWKSLQVIPTSKN